MIIFSQHLYRVKRGIATREPGNPNPLLFDASYPDTYYYEDIMPQQAINNRHRRQHSAAPSGNGAAGGGVGGVGGGFCENRRCSAKCQPNKHVALFLQILYKNFYDPWNLNCSMGYYTRLCKLYNAMWGKSPHNIQRDSSSEIRRHHGTSPNHHRSHHYHSPSHQGQPHTPNPKKHFRQAFHSRPDMTIGESDWTKASKHLNTVTSPSINQNSNDLPPTPCPSAAEYLTPVFARNHEGAWRYVVQIPKEGYFTQTVEVTKCLKSNCYYMDGSCKTSPRWQSLLVAELFYPDTTFPTTPKPITTTTTKTTTQGSPLQLSAENYPDYLYSKGTSASLENISVNNYSNELGLPFKKRSARSVNSKDSIQHACDGYDEVGCYQVRLFYDWFLIPGSCKCWRRQFDFTLRSNHG